MRILLLGATGRTGKWVLQQALEAGYNVHVLARNTGRITPHKNLKIIEGDVTSTKDLSEAIEGCSGAISCLNVSRTSDIPWSPLRTPAQLMSNCISSLLQVVEADSTIRIIVCSAWGVAETRNDIPGWFRWFIDNSNIGVAYKDHEKQEALLENSELNWTIVRPVGLTNGAIKEVQESTNNQPKPGLTISRRSLANYLLSCLENKELTRRKVVISH